MLDIGYITINILLTGATGFIGKHLLNLLISKGINVCCIVRDKNKLLEFHGSTKSLKIITGDLNEPSTFTKFPKSVDIFIHLAALLEDWNTDKQKLIKTNVEMIKRLLNWFSSSDCKQFILISTPGVQGFGHKLAKETDPYNPNPRKYYEKSKVLAEQMIQNQKYKPNQNWTIVRPDFVYGPEDFRRIKLYKRIKKRQWIKIGKGTSVLRPTHIHDVCNAIALCIDNPKTYSQILNVAGPELISSDDYIDTIAKTLKVKLFPIRLPTIMFKIIVILSEWIAMITNTRAFVAKSQVEFLTKDHGTDISKIKNLLGFTPTINFTKGIQETLTWAKDQKLL